MNRIGMISGGMIALLAIALGTAYIPRMRENAQLQKLQKEQGEEKANLDLKKTKELLAASKSEEALTLIQNYQEEIESLSERGIQWLELFMHASEQQKDIPQLVILFEFFPEIFKDHESPSLLVADAYIQANKIKDYQKIRSLWNDREIKISEWLVLDADQLLLEGRQSEAIELLKSRTFNNKSDIGRLVRLALLHANENPKTAWTYLGEAYSKDPMNPDICSYRARLLESVGKHNQAHKEYQEAARLDADNLYLKDQLAEFYLRQKQYPLAIKIWKEHLHAPSLDKFWMKSLFWSKIITPINFNWKDSPAPQGDLEPLIGYLINLEPGEFWCEKEFERLPHAHNYLKNHQETFWLKLLHALKNQREKEAMNLLKYNPFTTNSWFPELEKALKQILAYRQTGTFCFEQPFEHLENAKQPRQSALPIFFQQLDVLASETGDNSQTPEELHELLTSKEAFAAAFLVAGWNDAALQLHALPIIPSTFPGWVSVQLTQALHKNKSSIDALEFASLQKSTPELSLLICELMITGGDTEAALAKLKKLVQLDSNIGFRAAWLASLLYIENKDYEHARATIYSQPRLVHETLGKETLARIALLEGDSDLANTLYSSIEKTSSEARSYLAKKAYSEKDWKKARELTEQLIQDFPENAMLKENLKKILAEETQNIAST